MLDITGVFLFFIISDHRVSFLLIEGHHQRFKTSSNSLVNGKNVLFSFRYGVEAQDAVPCHVINVLYSFEEMRFSDTCCMNDIQN